MKEIINLIIIDLNNCVDFIQSKPLDVAFCLGSVVTRLEIIEQALKKEGENKENQLHGN